MRKALVFCLVIFTGIISLFTWPGCANIIPPTGGAKDTIPPLLLKASPPDSTVNFRSKSITFLFDEYLNDLQNTQENLIFAPTFRNNPIVEVRSKTLTIRFRETLDPNTTYVLNFGNAIADANETNILRGFTYTFSTGPVLDSLELTGRVVMAETGDIDTTLIAILHRNLSDSAVRKERPPYAVKLDGTGRFRFKNLPADTFAVYVLGEAGLLRTYQVNTQPFGFADKPVISGTNTDSLILYAYREVSKAQAGTTAPYRPGNNERRLRLNVPPGAQQELLGDYTISFPVPIRNFDSSKVHLSTDSTFTSVDFTARLDSTKKLLSFKTQWKENKQYNLVLEKDFASDTSGRQLFKTDTLFFNTKKMADYGNVLMRFRNLDLTKNPVLQFVRNNQVVNSIPLKSATLTQSIFQPGDYTLRLLYDTNGNGKWDPGKFFEGRKQPEIVEAIRQPVNIKADWDNEFDIVL